MSIPTEARRRAFSVWLRTGRLPALNNVELKFNPYHDPRNGQFTFAPGGPRSLRHVIISNRRKNKIDNPLPRETPQEQRGANEEPQGAFVKDVVDQSEQVRSLLRQASFSRAPGGGSRGSNSRAFHDPMTLQHVFPSLRNAPGGALVGIADNIFNLTGPARELTAELTARWTRQLISQIRLLIRTTGSSPWAHP